MRRSFILQLIFILLIQVVINYLCSLVFGANLLVAQLVSDALIALVFAYMVIPPEYRKGFYKQEIFHKTAITYFVIFTLISILFGVII